MARYQFAIWKTVTTLLMLTNWKLSATNKIETTLLTLTNHYGSGQNTVDTVSRPHMLLRYFLLPLLPCSSSLCILLLCFSSCPCYFAPLAATNCSHPTGEAAPPLLFPMLCLCHSSPLFAAYTNNKSSHVNNWKNYLWDEIMWLTKLEKEIPGKNRD
jgi:hypothetical protein